MSSPHVVALFEDIISQLQRVVAHLQAAHEDAARSLDQAGVAVMRMRQRDPRDPVVGVDQVTPRERMAPRLGRSSATPDLKQAIASSGQTIHSTAQLSGVSVDRLDQILAGRVDPTNAELAALRHVLPMWRPDGGRQ